MQLVILPVLTESEIKPAVMQFVREPNGGLMLLGDSFTRLHIKAIAELAARDRLPSIAPIYLAKVGGLMDYGPSSDLAQSRSWRSQDWSSVLTRQ